MLNFFRTFALISVIKITVLMKNKTKIISLMLFFFCSFYLVAQDLSYPTKVIDGKEYSSSSEAEKELGLYRGSVNDRCKRNWSGYERKLL